MLKKVTMGGRFGKYGDAKRKQRLRKTRLRPPDARQWRKVKPSRGPRKSKVSGERQRGGS